MEMMWSKRKSVRCLWSTLVIATLVLCIAFICISFTFGRDKYNFVSRISEEYPTGSEKLTEEECIPVCDSKECVFQSKILLENVQPAANPCENFNEFICGQFIEKRDPDETSTFVIRYLDQMMNYLRSILDNLDASSKSASGKMKIVYDSCMKYSSNDFQAIPTILQIFSNFGIRSWPNLSPDFAFVNSSITRVMANLLVYREYGFVQFSEDAYWGLEDPNSQINLTIVIENSYYGNKERILRKYQVDRVLKYFNLDDDTVSEIWEESEAIHDAIMNLKEESEKVHDENENSTAISIDCTLDNDWMDLCESLELFINFTDTNEKINKNYANIRGHEAHFMRNLFLVLSKFSDKSIANYLVLNVFLNHLNDLSFYFRLTHQKDPKAINDLDDVHISMSHWKHCVQWISSHMALALAHEFIKKDFAIPMMREVQNITEEVIQEMVESVSRQKWISGASLSVMTKQLGNIFILTKKFIELFPNETYANEFYEEYHPSNGSFFQNVFEFGKFIEMGQIRGYSTSDKLRWQESLFLPGASGGGGEISIEFGILFPPTYLTYLHRLINLASLGLIVAHEIGHNVQSFYIDFAESDHIAKDYYDAKSQCLEKQFEQFRMEAIGKNLNASRYSHENIADNMGVYIIDKLIEKYALDGEEIFLPNFPYSTSQLLYISSAQTFCSIHSKKKQELIYNLGSHSPENFRIIGMMQNSKGFSKAFRCPEGSYMNPSNKCFFLSEND